MYLRQNTATTVQVGPYINFADGNTELATLIQTATSFFFSKNDGTFALGTSTATIAGGTLGWYTLALASSDVNTAGRFKIYNHATAALYVERDYTVMASGPYDAMFATTGIFDVNVKQWGLATVASATGTAPNVNITNLNGNAVTATGTLFTADVIQWGHNPMATATGTTPNVNVTFLNGNAVTATGSLFPADVMAYNHSTTTATNPAIVNANVVSYTGNTVATATGSYPLANVIQIISLPPSTATQLGEAVRDTPNSTGTATDTLGGEIASINSAVAANLDSPVSNAGPAAWQAILEGGTATGFSAGDMMRLQSSALAGIVSGGPNNPAFQNISNTKQVFHGTADSSGNRTLSVMDDLT